MNELLHLAPRAFLSEGLVAQYLATVMRAPQIQDRRAQIAVMTSFFAFIAVFELGYATKPLLQVPA